MVATNRTDKVKLLVKTLQKRYKNISKPPERKLLECLMFAACLENATFDAAEAAFSVLEHHYIDWNELRVSTPQEIADTLPMLPQPLAAGERIKKTLQWVFETTYMFDLEEYRKKTIGQTVEYLDSIPSCTSFMTGYLVQIGLCGHQIPFDEAALRIMRRLDLTKVNNGREEVPGIERLVTKNKGVEFATMMHLFGMEFFDRQDDAELLALLQAIDKNAAERSWQEPEGVVKKADAKPIPTRVATPSPGRVKPVIDLDDEEVVEPVAPDENVEFIETNLAALGAGSKESGKPAGDSASSKSKKRTADKKKTPVQATFPELNAVATTPEPAPIAEPPKNTKADMQMAVDDKSVKKMPTKATPVAKPETKKTPQKKETPKQTANPTPKTAKTPPKKVPPKKVEPKSPKIPAKTTLPPKSATKKLQQKKPR